MKRSGSGFFPSIIVENSESSPMYRRLYDRVRSAILSGELRPGQKIPSTRCLASELKVSRITILGAFQLLSAEGYIESSTGSGTYVAKSIPDQVTRLGFGNQSRSIKPSRSSGTRRVSQLSARLITFPSMPFGIEAFRVGLPALDRFPVNIWSRLLASRWRQPRKELMGYGGAMGFQPCREAIAEYVTTVRGVRCDASQVMIVNGYQQGLEIAARTLLDPGDNVWIEEPGYPGAVQAFGSVTGKLTPVPVDDEGLDVKEGIRRCSSARAAFITPSHQFPMGMTMSAGRRMLLLDWAARNSSWIVEDDYDSEYDFRNRPIAAVQGLDTEARVIYVGTFSKILFPSLRLGYLIVPSDLVSAFCRIRRASDIAHSTLEQAVLTDFIQEGHLARHIRRMRMLYLERNELLSAELKKHLGDIVELVSAQAGMHLVCLLPSGVEDTIIWQRAIKAGVVSWPLSICCQGKPERGGLILGYGGVDRKQIPDAVKRLAAVIQGS
ncbi:MAG TPA: PLP-dependent aminotransferase family protein [Chthoniobacterales bacterium]|nr:PLP-dependent aminotransferase family protein [Chthoniobacterales bacterium]